MPSRRGRSGRGHPLRRGHIRVPARPLVANVSGLAGVGEGDGALEILVIGTLHEVKGQAVLVDACREFDSARGVAIRARFVGDGPDRTVLAERIAAAGLDGRGAAGSGRAPEARSQTCWP